jgi:hypothetical protein
VLTKKLEELRARPDTAEGKVVSVDVGPGDSPEMLTLNELAVRLGFVGADGYVDDHPEGSDRGGYVPTLFFHGASGSGVAQNVYYDECCCEWYEC